MPSSVNRINIYDSQLLRLEASKPLRNILERQKKAAYKKAEQKGKEAMDTYRLQAEVKQSEILRDYRETKAALRQQKSDTAVMEKEFIRIAKAFEKLEAKSAVKSGEDTKKVRRIGRVKGYGVKTADLNKAFNSTQKQAYAILCKIAEVTGIDIVLFQSKPDANGELRGGIVEGIDMNDSHGAFSWHNNKIYIDINAGVLKASEMGDVARYSMLRTFSHEFTHFIEKHNPEQYETFRDLVFDVMRRNGENPDALVDEYMDNHKGTSRDDASREVVAEAMTDILPQTSFVQELAQKHKKIHQKLLDKMKEFVADIKAYFKSIGTSMSKETAAVKEHIDGMVRYADELVEMFDRIAVQAVENYQAAETAQKNTASKSGGVQMQVRESFYKEFDAWDKKDTNKTFNVGTTSDALKSVGMKDQNIMLRSGTVLQKINKHKEMSFEIFKGIPELLEHPVIVQFSDAVDPKTNKPKYDSRITVLGELYADGKPVLVSLELLPTNQKKTVVLDFAIITSAYSKGALQQYLNENSILYIDPDKKRTNSWPMSLS